MACSAKISYVDFSEYVEVRRDVMMGKPCLAAGETRGEILAAYPQLGPDHIEACLEYAGHAGHPSGS